jgi:hypothetical protein
MISPSTASQNILKTCSCRTRAPFLISGHSASKLTWQGVFSESFTFLAGRDPVSQPRKPGVKCGHTLSKVCTSNMTKTHHSIHFGIQFDPQRQGEDLASCHGYIQRVIVLPKPAKQRQQCRETYIYWQARKIQVNDHLFEEDSGLVNQSHRSTIVNMLRLLLAGPGVQYNDTQGNQYSKKIVKSR